MRINANKKIHKMKRDPFRTLLRMAGILAIVVAVSVAALVTIGGLDIIKRRREMRHNEAQ